MKPYACDVCGLVLPWPFGSMGGIALPKEARVLCAEHSKKEVMKACPKQIEYRTHTSWWEPCALPEGHCGGCSSRMELQAVQAKGWHGSEYPALVSYPVDADGAPL